MSTNNKKNVSVVKGVAGGYFWSAPSGTTVPTDIKTALPEAFVNAGYISKDGIKSTIKTDSTDITDMNGDTVDSETSSRKETFDITFMEIAKNALSEIYGADNVTDAAGIITVKHNGDEPAERVGVMELVMKNGRRWRRVLPSYKRTDTGDESVGGGEASGRQITITALVDESGTSVYDYIESTETTAGA